MIQFSKHFSQAGTHTHTRYDHVIKYPYLYIYVQEYKQDNAHINQYDRPIKTLLKIEDKNTLTRCNVH